MKLGKRGAAIAAGIAGLTTVFFFDPRSGAKHRRQARSAVRRSAHIAAMAGSKIEKRPRRKPSAADEALASTIEESLRSRWGTAVDEVAVTVSEGAVTLRGEVDHLDDIDGMAAVAAGCPGVGDVHNVLRLSLTGSGLHLTAAG